MKDRANIICLPPVIYVVPLILGALLHFLWLPIAVASGSLTIKIIGSIVIILGIGLMGWAVRSFRQAGEDKNPYTPSHSIVTTGLFKFTRNPMYIGLALIYIGISLALNTLWPIFFLPLVLVVIHYGVVLREEEYMERKFGDEYIAYKTRVRRWF